MKRQPVDDPQKCPRCNEPNVHPRNTTADGLRFRRCPECYHSWFTQVTPAPSDGEAT